MIKEVSNSNGVNSNTCRNSSNTSWNAVSNSNGVNSNQDLISAIEQRLNVSNPNGVINSNEPPTFGL